MVEDAPYDDRLDWWAGVRALIGLAVWVAFAFGMYWFNHSIFTPWFNSWWRH